MEGGRLIAVVTGAALTAAASAEPIPTATYSVHFGSPAGPSEIEPVPGQTTTVYVAIQFEPGIGPSPGPVPTPILGLSDGGFSLALAGTATGSWSGLALDPPYNFALGNSTGTPLGLSVTGVLWGMGFFVQPLHPSPFNPDIVWSGTITWGSTPDISFLNFTDLAPTGVFVGGPIPSVVLYNSAGLSATILPSPNAATLLAFSGLIAARRRRPSP